MNDRSKIVPFNNKEALIMLFIVRGRRFFQCNVFVMVFFTILSGCVDINRIIKFNEITHVREIGEDICFFIANLGGYYTESVLIRSRVEPLKVNKLILMPNHSVNSGWLCIAPSTWRFPYSGQYIVSFSLFSKKDLDDARRFVAGVEMQRGHPYDTDLTDKEIFR